MIYAGWVWSGRWGMLASSRRIGASVHGIMNPIQEFELRCVMIRVLRHLFFFFFQAEDGIRDLTVTGVQTCALPISEADDGARQAKECLMDVVADLPTDAQSPEPMQQGKRLLDDPAVLAQPGAVFEIGRASCRERV